MTVQDIRDQLDTFPPDHEVFFLVRVIDKDKLKMLSVDIVGEARVEKTSFVVMMSDAPEPDFELN